MNDAELQNCRILIVDDEAANLYLLEGLLRRAGYQDLRSTADPRQVLPSTVSLSPISSCSTC